MTDETPPPPPPPHHEPASPPPPPAAEPPAVVAQPVVAQPVVAAPVVAAETRSTDVVLERRGPHPVLMLLVGFIVGALIGLAIAYLLFHSSTTTTPGGPTPSPTAVLRHLAGTF